MGHQKSLTNLLKRVSPRHTQQASNSPNPPLPAATHHQPQKTTKSTRTSPTFPAMKPKLVKTNSVRSCTRHKERDDLSYKNYCDKVQFKLNTRVNMWLDNSTSTDKMNTSGQQTKPQATLNNSRVIGRLASSSGSPVANPEMVES